MTPIKRNLLYIFRDSLLRLRITWNHGTALTLSVGYHVDKTDARGKSSWDGSRCRKNTTHGKDRISAGIINKALENLEDKVSKAFFFFENIDHIPSKEELKSRIENSDENTTKDQKKLIELIDEFLNEQSVLNQWSMSMLVNVRKCLLYLIEAYGPNIQLDDIDDTQYAKLLKFFYNRQTIVKTLDDVPIIRKGLKNTTINSYLNNIRRFVRWAEKKKYCTTCSIANQAPNLKTIKKPIIFLEWSELIKLKNLDLEFLEGYYNAREMFLFCCFTGLRYSDMKALRWSNVYEDHIEVVTQKTADRLSIDLNKFSKEILEKRKALKTEEDGFVFPQMSLNHYNVLLIKLAKMANIDSDIEFVQLSGAEKQVIKLKKYECISSHAGRRTFVCNSLSIGIPPNIVMKWTGHKNYKSMNPYIDITSSAKQENMKLFDNLPPLSPDSSSENSSDLS